MTWALDLDGVVWLAGRAIPGAAEAISELRAAGERVVFLTNNSGPRVASHVDALARAGIECQPDDLTTSAQAAASLLPPGSRAVVVGGEGIREALDARQVKEVGADESPEAVVVGREVELDYWALSAASTVIRGGTRFVATNTDATFPVGADDGGPPTLTTAGAGPAQRPAAMPFCRGPAPSWRSSPPPQAISRRWPVNRTKPWLTWSEPGTARSAWWWGTGLTLTACLRSG